jgi:hypothetical protein
LSALWGRSKVEKHLESEIHCSSLFLSEEGKVEKIVIARGEQWWTFFWYILLNLLFKGRDWEMDRDYDYSWWTFVANYL